MDKIIKTVLILLFLGCLGKWHYDYYLFVRYAGMVGFGLLAFLQKEKNDTLFWVFVVSLLLINPFYKIVLSKSLWQVIDIVWVFILANSLLNKENK